jgi:PadR family transcriptional regulator, regulatory protein PadR
MFATAVKPRTIAITQTNIVALPEIWLTAPQLPYIVGNMSTIPSLGEFEQIVLLAVLRLKAEAYGASIRTEIAERTGREPGSGALYTTLDRLEKKGLLKSRMGEPTPQRGGRAKRYYNVTASGAAAISRAQRAFRNMLNGVNLPPGGSLA